MVPNTDITKFDVGLNDDDPDENFEDDFFVKLFRNCYPYPYIPDWDFHQSLAALDKLGCCDIRSFLLLDFDDIQRTFTVVRKRILMLWIYTRLRLVEHVNYEEYTIANWTVGEFYDDFHIWEVRFHRVGYHDALDTVKSLPVQSILPQNDEPLTHDWKSNSNTDERVRRIVVDSSSDGADCSNSNSLK